MSITDLVPWHGNKKNLSVRKAHEPFHGLQKEINNLFENFFDEFDWLPSRFGGYEDRFGSFTPKIDIKEGKKRDFNFS